MTTTTFPDGGAPETSVRVTVPEEFIAMAISEVTARAGRITDLKVNSEGTVMRATLCLSEVDALTATVAAATDNRGKVESDV